MPPPDFLLDAVPRRTRRGVLAVLLGGLAAYRIVYTVALALLMGAVYGIWGGAAFQALDVDRAPYLWAVFAANALGQIVGLGVFAVWLADHEGPSWAAYLRLGAFQNTAGRVGTGQAGAALGGTGLGETEGAAMGWTVAGLLGLLPLVQLLGIFNGYVPLPESLRVAEAAQEAMFAGVLSRGSLVVNLLLLAAVPAVCEEVFFRGYVQRRLEVGGSAASAVVFSGLAFGLYHLRPSHLIPLSVVGVYLAYAVWRTGRLRASIAAHFAYNAVLIVLAWAGADPGTLPAIGWLVVPGVIVTIWALRRLPDAHAPEAA